MGLINISYTASDGTEFDLMAKGFRRISQGAFHDWKWAPDTTARQYGVRINKMQKKALEYEAKIMFQGTANERRKALNSFHSAIDMDCFNQTPGTLRWGNSYIRSYVTESSVEPDKDRPDRTINKVKFYCPVPFWYTEQTISIAPVSDHTALDTDKAYIDTEGENFGYGYPYSYKVELAAPHMDINHYAPSDFRLIVYGPAVNPTINIAGNQYKVNYSVEDGQVLIIDSRSTQPWDRRVYLVAGQTVINVFDYRDPAGSILKKIPPGDIAIGYARTYGIELTVYKERSEPEWITS